MSTSDEHPNPEEALTLARAVHGQMAAALGEAQEPEADEPPVDRVRARAVSGLA